MKTVATSSFLALSFAALALSEDLRARSVPGNNVISMSFVKERTPYASDSKIGRRRYESKLLKRRFGLTTRELAELQDRDINPRATISETLDNAQLLYYANVTMGTPGQKVRLQIDTGSSDVWANSANSQYCQSRKDPCNEGAFDENNSSTFTIVGQNEFNISYVDNTGATGSYFTDDFSIGGVSITNLTMGLATDTDIQAGIMGVGYDTNEAILQYTNSPYPSIIDTMKSQKLINTKAYSLWLNDLDDNSGSVLFGGIDTQKYQGSLIGLPIQATEGSNVITDFAVALSSVSYTSSSGHTTNVALSGGASSLAVILDSGSSLMYLPTSMVETIANAFGAEYEGQAGEYIIDCSAGSSSEYINIQFGGSKGPTIKVPISELVIPVQTVSGQQATDTQGNAICTFGLQPGDADQLLFGDAFLRSAYVVYDLDENTIYIAQTVFKQTASNVLEITAASGVPDVSGIASGATATITGTGIPRGTAAGTVTVTGSGTTATKTSGAAPGVVHPREFGYIFPVLSVILCAMVGGGALLL